MTDTHPATEELDRYRAGLLDRRRCGQVDEHLQRCAACRAHVRGWDQVRSALAQEPGIDTETRQALAVARSRAARAPAEPAWKTMTRPAAAIAAGLALALSVGLWHPWHAGDESPARLAGGGNGDIPELYEDPDFYLWLAGHDEVPEIYEDPDFYRWLSGQQESSTHSGTHFLRG